MKRSDVGGGLLLTVEDGGFWMCFSASDGTETKFDILTLASTMDPMTAHQDRRPV